MNPQASGAATGEAVETAPKQEVSLSDEIMALMRGEEIPPETETTHQEDPGEVTAPAETEIPQTEETHEEEPVHAEGQWPQSAKKRIAETTEQKKRHQARADRAESERDQWQQRAENAEARLAQASLPRPNARDPLADVLDMTGLVKAKGHYQNIKDVATQALDENPTLDQIEIETGRDKNDQPVIELFTRKKLVAMRRDAEHALSELIPTREKVLVARERGDALAFKVYPQFAENDGENEWTGFVRETLAQIPALAQVPDIAVWLGHALEGRRVTLERLVKQYGKNGEHTEGTPSTAKEIISAASRPFTKAPPVSTGRVPSQSTPRRGADVEAARRKMRANPGSDEAMGDFIDAKLFRTPSRGYMKVS